MKPSSSQSVPTERAAGPARLQVACNGIDATTGAYLLPALDVGQLARAATGDRPHGPELDDLRKKSLRSRGSSYVVVEGVDPNDLAQAGWAAVFPAVSDPASAARQAELLSALDPLLKLRRAQAAGGRLYREYKGEQGYHTGETKQQYLARLGAGPGPVRPEKVPYYLLLVATPEQIPFHVQYQLDVQYAVGRISFDTADEYARYARSVVDVETGQARRARRAAFFGVANPNDAATRLSADHLVLPLADYVGQRHAHRGWTVDRHLGPAATRDRLAEILRDPPALLFTASHGMAFPSGDAGQRDGQGALLCQDWAGPGQPVARTHYFAGDDIPARADLRGTIGVLFACYGGGTPLRDEFPRRALGEATARQLAPEPLIARLPQRMLAHRGGGALAVVAHVDRAWGSTFLWIDPQRKGPTQRYLDVFESMLDSVLVGKRLGYAMESFNVRYAELAADLNERIEQGEGEDDAELAHMWICNSDARNYAVFGDPAVCIPDSSAAAAAGDKPGEAAPRDRAAELTTDDNAAAPGAPARDAELTREPAGAPEYGWFGGKGSGGDGSDKQPGFLARLGNRVGELLGEVLTDAAVLEVKTYTSPDLQALAAGRPVRDSGARLRAYTRCKLDGDTEACVPTTETGAIDQAMWALHLELVKQAQDHRAELLRTVLSLFSSRVTPGSGG